MMLPTEVQTHVTAILRLIGRPDAIALEIDLDAGIVQRVEPRERFRRITAPRCHNQTMNFFQGDQVWRCGVCHKTANRFGRETGLTTAGE
jgi:ribosomal protein S27E